MKKYNITIGIPAYNEESNIENLLSCIFGQNTDSFNIQKIIIVSDNSTDKTVPNILKFNDHRITIYKNNKRMGKPYSQNIIIRNTKSDILVILDADISFGDKNFLNNLINPLIIDPSVGLTSADTIPAPPKKFVEKVIADSHNLKTTLYRGISREDNIYLCHGRARAFSKAFYSDLSIPSDCLAEDAFTYLMCKKRYKFVYVESAKVLFSAPSTIDDHARQSARFIQGKKELVKYFNEKELKKAYFIPNLIFIKFFLLFILKKPMSVYFYFLIMIYLKFFGRNKSNNFGAWEISSSTKYIIYDKN